MYGMMMRYWRYWRLLLPLLAYWICMYYSGPVTRKDDHEYRWYVAGSMQAYDNHKVSHQALRWRHNDHDGVSNHQPHGCLLNRLFRHRSRKTSKFRVTGLCAGNSPVTGEFPHKWPVTRKMFPFYDVIMKVVYKILFIHIQTSLQ